MSLQTVSSKATHPARLGKAVVSSSAARKVSAAATRDKLSLSSAAAPATTKDVPAWKWALAGLAVVPALGAAMLHPSEVFGSKQEGGLGGIWGLAKYMVGIA